MIVRREYRCVHRTGHSGHYGREPEDNSKTSLDIDTQQADHFPVAHARPDHHAESRKLQECKHAKDHDA